MENIEKLLQDVVARINSLPAGLTEEQVKGLIAEAKTEILTNPNGDFARKMKFGPAAADVRLFGTKFQRYGLDVADIEYLYDFQKALHEAFPNKYVGPSEELENAFNSVSTAFYISEDEIKNIDGKAIDGMFPRVPKAMDTAESGAGAQLVGNQYVGNLWEAARRQSLIFGGIPSFEMTQATTKLPVEVDIPEMLYVGENTSSTASDYATVATGSQVVSVTASKFLIHQMWSLELEEDSIIPFIPFLQMQAAKSLAHYLDSVVLNGDTTNAGTGNINLDDADPADTKHYLAFDGIRHAYLVDNTGNAVDCAGAVTLNKLLNLRTKLKDRTRLVDWGHPLDPNDLIYVADTDTADAIALLDEVKTVDKYGDKATVITGEVAKIGRHPLIASMAMGLTEADGKISTTGANNTLGQVAAFNKKGFVTGWRRRAKIEFERLPGRDQTRIVTSLRVGLGRFSPTGAASGITAAAGLYNISL